MRFASRYLSVPLLVALAGCSSSEDSNTELSVKVQPLVGGDTFSCAKAVTGLGTTDAEMWVTDFRLYIHNVKVITASGEKVPLTLTPDGQWQDEKTALLDFTNGKGKCDDANDATNKKLVGSIPDGVEPKGLSFQLGLPSKLNHIDATTAAAPFNDTGMWWTWSGGYKWMRLDFENESGGSFFFHHGETGCDGSIEDGFDCEYKNQTRIEIEDFDFESDKLVIDVDELFSGSDFDTPVDFGSGDVVKGCMAFGSDPECTPIFERLGIQYEKSAKADEQIVFKAK